MQFTWMLIEMNNKNGNISQMLNVAKDELIVDNIEMSSIVVATTGFYQSAGHIQFIR